MRTFVLLLALLGVFQTAWSSDLAREKRWADEVLPSILDGDTVWLELAGGHKFLALFLPAAQAKGAVIVAHGMGVHPDWGVNNALRTKLAEQGYATLSIQMPILASDATPGDYVATYPEAKERLAKAAAWLEAKGFSKAAIVSHSLGGRMARAYVLDKPAPVVKAWAAISMGFDDFVGVTLPVLDLYGETDHAPVLKMQKERKQSLKHKASVQKKMAGANHFYEGKEAQAAQIVREWLDKAM